MWFSVVCTLIDICHHIGQHIVHLVSAQQNLTIDNSTDNVETHSICFLPQKDRDVKKKKAMSVTISRSGWCISQNKRL